jgi:two-component system NtrC family sensor kinase
MKKLRELTSYKSLQTKITLTFILVVVISGIINIGLGIKFIGNGIINQAQTRVRADLNSASEIYKTSEEKILNVAKCTANRFFVRDLLLKQKAAKVPVELRRVQRTEKIDFIAIVDHHCRVILRTNNPYLHGDDMCQNNVIQHCLLHKTPVVSTQLLHEQELVREDSSLVTLAKVNIIPTPRAKFQREGIETTAMVLFAAAPVFDNKENVIGVVYCGKLINNNFEIVDKIKNTVFSAEQYKGRDIGTATIFMKDLRISTNVMKQDGTRAIGTLVSKEVYEAVMEKGLFWIDRAFVVNDWYITSYMPIRNIKDEIIGILYVGILEQKYSDMRNQIAMIFIGITLLSMLAVFGFSYLLANNITKPLRNIASAAKKIAQGDFPSKIAIKTQDEIADLGKAFQFMISSLKARDQELKESVSKTVAETERLATIGQLSAGVAHEINNPLTGILLYCDLILKNMAKNDPQRENLEKIGIEAKRCKNIIKGLLDFSRPKKPEIKESSINNLIESTLALVKNQALFQNIVIKKELDISLPNIKIDPNQIQQVFMNLIINAAEAMNGKGDLAIKSKLAEDKKNIEISFCDNGPGIEPDNLNKIFEPFFTTKETSHGVGLGLAISYRTIKHHRGSIDVKSERSRGTTFTIKLPL